MIEIKHLTKKFDEVIAVNDLTIDIPTGITGLVGHNGAGKSTLFRLITGVYKNDSGEILIDKHDSKLPEAKRKIFFLCDNPLVPNSAKPMGVYSFYSDLFDIDKEKYIQLLEKFDIPMDRKVSNFSKGMKRQVFIALALSMECEILLLDEAFDGLDPLVLELIKEEMISLADENKTIVISSHNVSVLERLVDRFILLHKGKLGKAAESQDIGNSFNKYQALFNTSVGEEDFVKLGYEVISLKRVGSLINVVISGEVDESLIQKELKPILFEKIAIDVSEIVALEMLIAKKRGEEQLWFQDYLNHNSKACFSQA